ncbi:MAG: sulfatase-like hydrolase/transferase [Opitutaceae bacterium]|nr:sulfatase-like hydrolase/transferase [Opitutaceae bacterium]
MKTILRGCLLLAASTALSLAATTTPERPNIIFILADDYGTGEVGCYGADNYKTPNLDRLARQGVRYTNAYTVPLCGPSRALIMTGRYAFRTGATNQDATGKLTPAAEIMMPTVLKSAGYITSMVGKWGQLPLGPGEFGFDDYLKIKGSGTYWNTQDRGKTYLLNGRDVPLRDKEYLPDLMHRHVVDFISRNRNRPFYVYYSLSHVHTDILPTPDSAPNSRDHYTDNVVYMDKLVGRLMDELDRLNLREKTLVVFLGDNGTTNTQAPRATIRGRPLSGAKGSMLEGGGLVPMMVSWPGRIPAGTVSKNMIDASDFFPTFAELAGAKLPPKTIDGRSFAAQLRGEKGPSRAWAFNQLARSWWVREPGWKLNQSGELFDMSDAPFGEKLVPVDTRDAAAVAARRRLQAALDQLNPAGGIVDTGDASGRHAKNVERSKKKK